MPHDPTTVVWFRRDLRLDDHPALAAACARGAVVCLFVIDPGILDRRHHQSPPRLRFLRAGLQALDRQLRARGSRLVVRSGDPAHVVAAVALECGADRVHATREISPLGRRRDRRAHDVLRAAGVEFVRFDGDLVVPPEALPGPGGRGYRVFTPFYRAWLDQPIPGPIGAPDRIDGPSRLTDGLDALDELPGGEPAFAAGALAAADRLRAFVADGHADRYADDRDMLGADGTSRISAYLRFGMCTPAQVARAIGPDRGTRGRDAFWRQIAWREFAHHVMWWHPDVARRAQHEQFRTMRWDDDPVHLAAWTRGQTGYPLVDAAMRQLASTGWVHNRARMVAASFLVKDLLVDWRRGETVFMRGLIDGDPASNNLGWQWVAGTGTDAAPFFRVMNPIRQAERFDPDGTYVKRHVPELRDVPVEHIHEPWRMAPETQRGAGCIIGVDYPAPLVDHLERRRLAVARYRDATSPPGAG